MSKNIRLFFRLAIDLFPVFAIRLFVALPIHLLFVSYRNLQKCVLCLCWELKTPLDMFRPISFLEKFPTFFVDVILSPLSLYGVATLFPLPNNTNTNNKYLIHRHYVLAA